LEFGGAGAFGTGANMAYRRRVFDAIGGFDPALDVGTATNGGGDLEMFFRVLKHGHTLVYDPAAMVRHRHRQDHPSLQVQITNNGIGFYAYLARTAARYPDERIAVARLGAWWFRWWSLRRLARKLIGREDIPFGLIWGELVGSLRGPFRYGVAQREADRISGASGQTLPLLSPAAPPPAVQQGEREAVRAIDLSEPLQSINDVAPFRRVHLFVFWRRRPLGRLQFENRGRAISVAELRDTLSWNLPQAILDPQHHVGDDVFWNEFAARFEAWRERRTTDAVHEQDRRALAITTPVSIVVATRNRPDELRACLTSLTTQHTNHPLEIIVVDNDPHRSATGSSATQTVVSHFPGVRLVFEPRQGLSYARNCGILSATGSIIVTTDDDVVCDARWVERLVAPFARSEVMVVTGNVLPLELDTAAQQHFEMYGGLGRGYSPVEFNGEWMRRCRRSVPTWEIGCTANAAFRASIFTDPEIGLMDESLGAGMPAGCSEDTLAFYRVLRAGYTIVYEPSAFVWHRHRRTMAALRKQIVNYSKGHVAYHLVTLFEHGDIRALVRLGFELPMMFTVRLWRWAQRQNDYPLPFILCEIYGTLAGPWALWRSRRRVKQLGRSYAVTPLQSDSTHLPDTTSGVTPRPSARTGIDAASEMRGTVQPGAHHKTSATAAPHQPTSTPVVGRLAR
jgi:GT2 family glycosyltransferase